MMVVADGPDRALRPSGEAVALDRILHRRGWTVVSVPHHVWRRAGSAAGR